MIDEMDDSEFKEIREKAIKENESRQGKEKKEYYDTRAYVWTGEKRFRIE